MPITPSMWPLDGTAPRSSCLGTSARRTGCMLSVTVRDHRTPQMCFSQGSLREGGGHVVSGLHPGRAERRAATVPGRE